MKKLFRGLLVVVMILSLMLTAFATNGSKTMTTELEVKDSEGHTIDIEWGDPTEEIIFTEHGPDVDFGDYEPEGEMSVVYAQDLHSDVLPVTITFRVDGTGANDVLHVFHHDGEDWEYKGSGTGGEVTVTFDELSPVAIILEDIDESQTDRPGPGGTGDDGPSAPQTGLDMTMLYTGAAVFVVAAIVAVVTGKKRAA